MFSTMSKVSAGRTLMRSFSSSSKRQAKVAVLGASGGIGQPMSLLIKQSPLVSHLSLYDIAHTPGVAADLSHINTGAVVTGHMGPDQLHFFTCFVPKNQQNQKEHGTRMMNF
ncbi:malate dehydrogenase, mitochondrial [Trichonephila clavipes]|nr:malate dehydrogenase, mitochondrial [Trichonephila clavipes]